MSLILYSCSACVLALNPLTTEFFPPRQHIFMHSVHTTFVCTSLPQHSLLSGQTWWGPHTWRDPSGNIVNDIHDPHNPTEFFPPRQHIFMHSVHTTFVGTSLPQHSLLSGQTWWGSHTWRDLSGNIVNDIHDPHNPVCHVVFGRMVECSTCKQ